MKSKFVFFVAVIISLNALPQTATSVANGNFLTPTTWDCMCVPTDGYSITINHEVSLSIDYMMSSGGMVISSTGSLIESGAGHGILFTGTLNLNNQGTFNFSKLAVYSGTFANSGTMSGLDSLYIGVDLTNTGTIDAMDVLNTGAFINNANIDAFNFLNEGSFTNNDNADFDNFFNDSAAINNTSLVCVDFYNNNTFINNLNVSISGDFTNAHTFTNASSGLFDVMQNATNGDTAYHDAAWVNDGAVVIYANFQNIDSLMGSGYFCIGMNTANYGYMDGTYEFCDNNNPGTIDLNTGFIGTGITYCSAPCLGAIEETANFYINVFPNPAVEIIQIVSSETIDGYFVHDISGRVLAEGMPLEKEFPIDVKDFPSGLYFIELNAENIVKTILFVVE